MKSGNRSNALLVELLIVVMFFMLSATMLLQVFAKARSQSDRAGIITHALLDAQNVAERLSASQEPEQALKGMGFTQEERMQVLYGDSSADDVPAGFARTQETRIRNRETVWVLPGEEYDTEVAFDREALAAGSMLRQEVRIVKNGERLITLPVSQYAEVQP